MKLLGPISILGGLILLFAYLVSISAFCYWLTATKITTAHRFVSGGEVLFWFAVFGILSVMWGRLRGILNLTTLHALYSDRLVRTYLGASNPSRWEAEGAGVTKPDKDDDMPFVDYKPYENGGPLHIINTTFNETMSGESQLDQRDRKGLPLAVSPIAMSAGVSHHAQINTSNDIDKARYSHKVPLKPIEIKGQEQESVSKTDGNKKVGSFKIFPKDTKIKAEALTLGEWVGISGAAVSTGMGSHTNVGLSIVLAFFNIRLGYWWDSGIAPRKRETRTHYAVPSEILLGLVKAFRFVFRTQSYLLDEAFGRFHGPARRLWNLSDGGHFENTGVYELIRRELPLILCLDNGADPKYEFADLGNLVRRARTDFGAEIEFVTIKKVKEKTNGAQQEKKEKKVKYVVKKTPDWLKEEYKDLLQTIVEEGNGFFGSVEHLKREDTKHNPDVPLSKCHASLAAARYKKSGKQGILILLKPTLTGDEPQDVQQYYVAHKDFPDETTADQFFDEAQWESYRKLGHHIGEQLMDCLPKLQASNDSRSVDT